MDKKEKKAMDAQTHAYNVRPVLDIQPLRSGRVKSGIA